MDVTSVRMAEVGMSSGKSLTFVLAACLLLSLALLGGCGKGPAPAERGPQVTVEESGSGAGERITVQGEGGSSDIEVTPLEPSEEALGMPIYPGAEVVPGSALASRTTQGEKALETVQAEFTTGDALKKVVSWYRGRLGQPLEENQEGVTWVTQDESGVRSVMVETGEGGTTIKILKLSGDLDIELQGESP